MITRTFTNKMKKESNKRIIFYDFETTGFNPYHSEIIEIGALDNYGNTFNLLLKPTTPLRPRITEITGITNELLNEQGVSQKEGLSTFNDFLNKYDDLFKQSTYMIAHNNHSFDKLFLSHQFDKYTIPLQLHDFTFKDTLRISQLLLGHLYSHSMNSLCKYFNIVNEDQHRALGDCKALKKLFEPLQHLFKVKYYTNNIEDINTILDKPFSSKSASQIG